jgi:surface protein
MNGYIQEISIYSGNQSSNRAPIQQNINTYFNIYTPLPYNQTSNSLSLFSSPTLVAGAANAAPTELITGGPEGLITVSRTGSSNYTLWKNRVPTRTTLPASTPLSNEIYLNSANLSNALFSGSQNNVSYASVGAGLTDDEVYTYYELVDNLQTGLGRSKSTNPNAFITTWDTRISGTGTISNTSSIVLPLYGTQAITASWGDGTVSLISSSAQVDRTHSYATPGIYTVSITGQGQGFQFNNGGDRAKLIDVGQWGSISGSTTAMFRGCDNLVGTAADALTIETTSLSSAFQNATRFNGYLNNWRPISCSNFQSMFAAATAFNQPIGNWPLSASSINMQGMLSSATSFNQNIGSWDVSKVTNMSYIFYNSNFNNGGSDSIKNWRPVSCSDVSGMFRGAPFNQPIGSWPITASNMAYMLATSAFNQNIGSWDVSKVTGSNSDQGFHNMFGNATSFNNGGSPSIGNWRFTTSSTVTMLAMFSSAQAFNQNIGAWNVEKVTNMAGMFGSAAAFNQNIGSWNVEKVTNMSGMFGFATNFNNSGSNSINNWRPISCSNFTSMFYGPTNFNQPIGNWPLSASNINMEAMFIFTQAFNQDIGSWDMSRVIDIRNMFRGAIAFNNSGSSSINNWNVSNITSTFRMFSNASVFNQNIGNWFSGANNITDMQEMFIAATAFNNGGSSDISNWDVSKVTTMQRMFESARAFNQPIGSWDVSKVTSMASMLRDADAFNQDIGSWNLSSCTSLTNFMLDIPAANYSFLHTIYDGWINNKLKPNLQLVNFGGIKYSGSAAEGRGLLARAYNTGSIIGSNDDAGQLAITCSVNHNVVAGNKIFISGSTFGGINGVQVVQSTGSATTLTLAGVPYNPTANNGEVTTGYGWSITDGGVV